MGGKGPLSFCLNNRLGLERNSDQYKLGDNLFYTPLILLSPAPDLPRSNGKPYAFFHFLIGPDRQPWPTTRRNERAA
jgi:hypothetical protein